MVSSLFVIVLLICCIHVSLQYNDFNIDIKAENDSIAEWHEVIVSGDVIYLKFYTRDQLVHECPVCLCYFSSNTSIPPYQKGSSSHNAIGVHGDLFFGNCCQSGEEICVHWVKMYKYQGFIASLSDQIGIQSMVDKSDGYDSVVIGIKLYENAKISEELKSFEHALPRIVETINPVTNAAVSTIQMKLIQQNDKCKNFIEFQKNAQLLPRPPTTVIVYVIQNQTEIVYISNGNGYGMTWIISILSGFGSLILNFYNYLQ